MRYPPGQSVRGTELSKIWCLCMCRATVVINQAQEDVYEESVRVQTIVVMKAQVCVRGDVSGLRVC